MRLESFRSIQPTRPVVPSVPDNVYPIHLPGTVLTPNNVVSIPDPNNPTSPDPQIPTYFTVPEIDPDDSDLDNIVDVIADTTQGTDDGDDSTDGNAFDFGSFFPMMMMMLLMGGGGLVGGLFGGKSEEETTEGGVTINIGDDSGDDWI